MMSLIQPLSATPLPENTLIAIKARLSSFDHRGTIWYQQIEDPSSFYLFIPTTAPASHVNESSELVERLASGFDLRIETITLDAHEALDASPFTAPVITIGRHSIKHENVEGLEKTFREVKCVLEEFTGRSLAWAWKDGEFILVSGWESVDQHGEFAESKSFKEYARIRELVEGFEVCHARALERE